ncbi:MAG: methionine repressor-like protein [Betaproteobacteria bacterium]|nr:methionine repressor-like protein [Betaproteobacteria bacterium]
MATVRWSLKVSPDTDAAVRNYLGQIGGRKGDLSHFVERAVRERLAQVAQEISGASQARPYILDDEFAATVDAIRDRARSLTEAQVGKLVSEAVASARGRG